MNRRAMIFAILIALLFSLVPILQSPVKADCPEIITPTEQVGLQGAITADSINLRSEPNTTSASLGILRRNDVVMVTGRNGIGTWAQITTSTGIVGWVGSPYVLLLNNAKFSDVPVVDEESNTAGSTSGPASGGLQGAITADSINLRSEPNTTSASLGILRSNDVVMVTGRNVDGTWAQISTSAGVVGWIGSPFVVLLQGKFSDVPVVDPNAPAAAATEEATATAEATGEATDCPPTPTGDGAATPAAEATSDASSGSVSAGLKGAITADSIHVRSEPNQNSQDLGIVRRNDVVMVVGRNEIGTWAKITTSNGVTGWLGSAYVVLLEGKFRDLPTMTQ
jgi:uncharacterized protein YgiM (DUF1202 family)